MEYLLIIITFIVILPSLFHCSYYFNCCYWHFPSALLIIININMVVAIVIIIIIITFIIGLIFVTSFFLFIFI